MSLYFTYSLIAFIPVLPFLLPFPEDTKRKSKGRIGLFGTYFFFFFIVVFLATAPTIVQAYFLSLTLEYLMGTILVFIALGAILLHGVPLLVHRGALTMTKSNMIAACAALGTLYLLTIPLYHTLAWALVQYVFS